ncbi:MAG: glycosyltransferase [Dehalococcoidia bacterium]|nr:glycosyltransferase [Dehalococcoidia bacterium]
MKRIAMLSVHTCPLGHLGTRDSGGMNVYVRELSRELGELGTNVDVFTRYRNCDHPCEVKLGEGSRLVHLGAGERPELSKYDLYDYLPEFAGNVVSYQQENGLSYDLVHSHYWLSGWVGELLKACWNVPHLTTFHTLGRLKTLNHETEPEPELRLSTEERVVRQADRVLALTEIEKSQLIALYGTEANRISVVPGGIDLGVFRRHNRDNARKALGLDTDERIVLYVGRMEPLKGVDILIKALAQMSGVERLRCLAVGGNSNDDGEVAELRNLAESAGVASRMTFLGPVEHEKLPLYYSAAEVTAVPSRYESFGLVALESLACGTPVVASDVGGLPTIVRDGHNGLLVPRFEPSGFAASLSRVLLDSSLRNCLSARATATTGEFSWGGIVPRILDLYREMALASTVV